jgi:hypothetical protein
MRGEKDHDGTQHLPRGPRKRDSGHRHVRTATRGLIAHRIVPTGSATLDPSW